VLAILNKLVNEKYKKDATHLEDLALIILRDHPHVLEADDLFVGKRTLVGFVLLVFLLSACAVVAVLSFAPRDHHLCWV
jgi:hypothetical protein